MFWPVYVDGFWSHSKYYVQHIWTERNSFPRVHNNEFLSFIKINELFMKS